MPISDWPHHERPREKLLMRGAAALSDAELLAILLRTGVKGKTAVDVARQLLKDFGSLRAILEANQQQFCRRYGLGSAKYTEFQAILEVGRRHLREALERHDAIKSPQDTYRYLTAQLRGYQQEVFACLFLDTRYRLITYEELFFGTINSTTVHPREVVKRALSHNASAVILAHNHPSGVAEPSLADKQITERLQQALALIDVQVLDHIVVGDGEEVTSFLERGLL